MENHDIKAKQRVSQVCYKFYSFSTNYALNLQKNGIQEGTKILIQGFWVFKLSFFKEMDYKKYFMSVYYYFKHISEGTEQP